ncbi:MAG: hypothetical protein PHX50_16920 [Massilibacteroides sp.]|nr:hypothetical protein [Massilibacteroides sp.]
MRIIRNKFIPFPGYKAINLFGVLFVKNNAKIDGVTLNHESIHSRQFVELMVLFAVATVFIRWWLPVFAPFAFYVWYVVEWLVRLPSGDAYRNISFEREAYANEYDSEYLKKREFFAFLKYLR